jgi:hypothetical protein
VDDAGCVGADEGVGDLDGVLEGVAQGEAGLADQAVEGLPGTNSMAM